MSRSALFGRITLANRLDRLVPVAQALERGEIGYEAAQLIARISTRPHARAWVERARRRTFKHLKEDVEAVELMVRVPRGGRK